MSGGLEGRSEVQCRRERVHRRHHRVMSGNHLRMACVTVGNIFVSAEDWHMLSRPHLWQEKGVNMGAVQGLYLSEKNLLVEKNIEIIHRERDKGTGRRGYVR